MALFKAEKVSFRSRTEELIHEVSLEIHEKKTTIIGGASGSGKSLLLKLLGGILLPSSGRILFDGADIAAMSGSEERKFRRRCAFVFQDAALWANQSIEQNLSLPLRTMFPKMGAREREQRMREVCEQMKFFRPLSLRPASLSSGEQKLVAFARAIICRPEILLLDECTESLDSDGAAPIVAMLHDFLDKGNTMVYISHRNSFISEFPGETVFLKSGRLESESA